MYVRNYGSKVRKLEVTVWYAPMSSNDDNATKYACSYHLLETFCSVDHNHSLVESSTYPGRRFESRNKNDLNHNFKEF
jgi:hypothetical protein